MGQNGGPAAALNECSAGANLSLVVLVPCPPGVACCGSCRLGCFAPARCAICPTLCGCVFANQQRVPLFALGSRPLRGWRVPTQLLAAMPVPMLRHSAHSSTCHGARAVLMAVLRALSMCWPRAWWWPCACVAVVCWPVHCGGRIATACTDWYIVRMFRSWQGVARWCAVNKQVRCHKVIWPLVDPLPQLPAVRLTR